MASEAAVSADLDFAESPKTRSFLNAQRTRIFEETDRTFAKLFGFQWAAGLAIALWATPFSWSGTVRHIHPHVWFALLLGGAISLFPILLVKIQPGTTLTRHVIAASQMLTSSLLIHLTGGRIETHFHIFGSLAFLAFYRDWRVLVTASAITAADHFLRGVYWPASIYGAEWSNHWRWIEHVGWVLFADVFLIRSCMRSQLEMLSIAQRQARQEDLLYQAQHDALTGLPNRLLFAQKMHSGLEKARACSAKLGLLYLDLDRFKQINDSLGHEVGDELLRSVGERLTESLEPGESVIRMGGDEFALICEDIRSTMEPKRTAARMLRAISEEFHVSGHQLRIGASIGISVYPDSGSDASELQKHADIAMYRAKKGQGNSFQCFSADLEQSTVKRMELEYDLRLALERGQLVLNYQPQVRFDGSLTGFEALIRWMHPQHGLIPPVQFIPLAEEIGLIGPIGEWCLQEACGRAAEWQRRFGQSLRMAVNVSALQFGDARFPATVSRVLEQTGFPARLLELELTETLVMADVEVAVTRMQKLRDLGVRIAIDDFGTGYSSLLYLQKLPIDALKIDRGFVQGMDTEVTTLPVVKSIIGLAHNLNLDVIAEGVEVQLQARMLMNLGCDYAQGFLFNKPVSAEIADEVVNAAAERRERSAA